MAENKDPIRLPLWLEGLLLLLRIAGVGVLVLAMLAFRLARAGGGGDRILLIVIALSVAVGLFLTAGARIYARMVVADYARPQPSRRIALMRVLCGVLVSVPAFIGFRTGTTALRMLSNLTVGILPSAEFGALTVLPYALLFAIGVVELVNGAMAISGVRVFRFLPYGLFALVAVGIPLVIPKLVPVQRMTIVPVAKATDRIAIGPDARYLAATVKDRIRVREVTTGERLFDEQTPEGNTYRDPRDRFIVQLVFNHDGSQVATVDAGGTLVIRRVPSGEIVLTVDTTGAKPSEPGATNKTHDPTQSQSTSLPKDLAFSPDGEDVFLATGEEFQSIDLESGKIKKEFHYPRQGDLSAISSNGTHVAVGGNSGKTNDMQTWLSVWNIENGQETFTKSFEDCTIKTVDCSPVGALVVVELDYDDKRMPSELDQVFLFDGETGNKLWSASEGIPVISSDGAFVFLGKSGCILNARSGEEIYRMSLVPWESNDISLTSTMSHAAFRDSESVQVWDLTNCIDRKDQ